MTARRKYPGTSPIGGDEKDGAFDRWWNDRGLSGDQSRHPFTVMIVRIRSICRINCGILYGSLIAICTGSVRILISLTAFSAALRTGKFSKIGGVHSLVRNYRRLQFLPKNNLSRAPLWQSRYSRRDASGTPII